METLAALTAPEEGLVAAARSGAWCTFATESSKKVRAEVLAALARSEARSGPSDCGLAEQGRKICLRGGHIVGRLDLDFANVAVPMFFEDCEFDSEITMRHAIVRGLSMRKSRIRGLDCREAEFQSSLDLCDGLHCDGEVNLAGARINGQLNCTRIHIHNPGGTALIANELKTSHGVYFNKGSRCDGYVAFIKASIGGSLRCLGGQFVNPTGTALDLSGAEFGGGIFIRQIPVTEGSRPGIQGKVLLRGASCSVYSDDRSAWPMRGCLVLDGFRYTQLTDTETSASARVAWLKLQVPDHLSKNGFRPQPWEQAATVLRTMGHEWDARQILIRKRDAQIRSGVFGFWGGLWNLILGMVVGHGYQPWRGVAWSLVLILLGTLAMYESSRCRWVAPAAPDVLLALSKGEISEVPRNYPAFDPTLMAIDLYFPILDLGQSAYWRIGSPEQKVAENAESLYMKPTSNLCQSVSAKAVDRLIFIYKFLGLMISSLVILAFSGVLRKD